MGIRYENLGKVSSPPITHYQLPITHYPSVDSRPNTRSNTLVTLYPESIDSSGSFRNRCRKHRVITRRISYTVTSVRPSKAVKALAARFVTKSPRSPSTSNSAQTWEIFTRKSRSIVTDFNL